jgi:alkanesulfonate monooxygenase SsuD/methylene tetrahydromethanopterin reductase-like flavin-dependent oxidoreductase (luciferase family)
VATCARGAALTSLVDEVARMEERGFASYWFSQVDTYEALTVIALAGQQKRTIELGVGVLPTYPRHPQALAQQAATANVLAGRRGGGRHNHLDGRLQNNQSNTAPRITEAARKAGRGTPPRIIVGLPVCVHDNVQEAVDRSVQMFRGYEQLPNYQRQLDAEGLDQAGEIAVVGNERQVTEQLQGYFDAGATEILASVFPAGKDGQASFQRTYELLESLASERS